MAIRSARISSVTALWALSLVTELVMLAWHALNCSAMSLVSFVWKDSNSDLVTVLVLPMLELLLRGLLAVVTPPSGSGGNSSVDSGSKTN
jgi:hypothetical protein